MNIVLIGYRGVGKSSVGRKLALCLQRKFIDTDVLIEERQQRSVSEIVKSQGWEHFRQMEKSIVEEIAEQDHLVIATGGGAVLDPENISAFKKNGMIVWLSADGKALQERMAGDSRTVDQRPSLTGKGTLEELEEMIAFRTPFYQRAMEVQLDTSAMSVEAVVISIFSILRERNVI